MDVTIIEKTFGIKNNKILSGAELAEKYNAELSVEFDQFLEFAKYFKETLGYSIFKTEWKIYSEKYSVAGCVDAVFYNGATDEYCIVDWKRVECDLNGDNDESVRAKNVAPPFEKLPDTKYGQFCFQLLMYKKILEKHYGLKIKECFIVQFYHTRPGYSIVPVGCEW